MAVGLVAHLLTDPPPRCRRTAPASPTRVASGRTAVFAVDLDLASKRASVQTLQIATWVQAERRRRAVGRAAWMPRERCQDMDVRSARAHGASPSLRYSDEGGTKPGARTLGYLVSFQVTRRRRNRSGVSQSPICRTLLRGVSRFPAAHGTLWEQCDSPGRGWTIGVGQAAHLQLINRYRCRRDLRHLPQELRQDGQLCSLLILILILLLARVSPDDTDRDLGAGRTQAARSGPNGMDAARALPGHGCPFSAGPRSVAGVREPEERGPNQEPGHLVTWCLFK
jgi:hypothetical protein